MAVTASAARKSIVPIQTLSSKEESRNTKMDCRAALAVTGVKTCLTSSFFINIKRHHEGVENALNGSRFAGNQEVGEGGEVGVGARSDWEGVRQGAIFISCALAG